MPEVIRNRFQNPSSARDGDYQDASRTRPGFGPDEDPLAELARIVGETAPIPQAPTQSQPAPRRAPLESREPTTAQREYPRRDTSWRDPQTRTTVRAGITPQPMPGQLEDLEAELFSEIRSENLRNLPPAPDLAQLGLPDARMPHYQPMSQASAAQTRQSAPSGPYAASGPIRANQGDPSLDDEVTLPMHSVLRATPPSARASEGHGMQQPPRFNPAPVQQATPATVPGVRHDAYGHEPDYGAHEDYDPAGALGAAYHDYDQAEAPYYAHGDDHQAQPPAPPSVHGPAGNTGYPPIPAQHSQYGHDAQYEDEYESLPSRYQQPHVNRRPPQRRSNSLMLGAMTVIGVLVLGVGSVFAYRAIAGNGGTGANAPLIRADTHPMKELVAQQPLGATGPNLDTARPDGQDKLVTQTEDPVDQIPGKPVRVVGPATQNPSLAPVQRVRSVIVRPDGTIVTPEDTGAKPATIVPPVRTASLPTADAPVVPPTPVQTAPVQTAPAQILTPQPAPVPPVAVRPVPATPAAALPPLGSVTHIDPVPVVQKPNPAPAILAAPKPPVAQIQPPAKPVKPLPALVPHSSAPPPETNGPLALGPSAGPAQITPPARVATAAPSASAAPAPRATPVDGGTGDYMVQISSQRSDAEAHHALQAAVQKYAALGAKGGDVQQADLGARGTYYRARLAGGTREQAAAMCSQIKAQGGDCVVSKR